MTEAGWNGEVEADHLLYDEKLLVIGCMSVMLGKMATSIDDNIHKKRSPFISLEKYMVNRK